MQSNTAQQLEPVEERALSLPEKARGITITDAPSFERAGEFLVGVKTLRNEIADTFDPVIDQAHKAHRAALDAKRKVEAPVAEAETIVKQGMARFQTEQDRRRREAEESARRERERLEAVARARADAERVRLAREAEERRLAAALEAEERGDQEAAARIIEQPEPVLFVAPEEPFFVPPVQIEQPKAKGVSFSEIWKFAVDDEAALPREYTTPDMKKLGGVVRAMKGAAKIPGVRVWAEKTVTAKAS